MPDRGSTLENGREELSEIGGKTFLIGK